MPDGFTSVSGPRGNPSTPTSSRTWPSTTASKARSALRAPTRIARRMVPFTRQRLPEVRHCWPSPKRLPVSNTNAGQPATTAPRNQYRRLLLD